METTGERLVDMSTLISDTALNHFVNISTGDLIFRIYGKYAVSYVGTTSKNIQYLAPEAIAVKYVKPETMAAKYLGVRKSNIVYIPKETINVKLICKP